MPPSNHTDFRHSKKSEWTLIDWISCWGWLDLIWRPSEYHCGSIDPPWQKWPTMRTMTLAELSLLLLVVGMRSAFGRECVLDSDCEQSQQFGRIQAIQVEFLKQEEWFFAPQKKTLHRLNLIPALLLKQVRAFPPPLQTNPMWPMGKLFSCQVKF